MAITIPWSSRRCTARTSSGRPSAMSASNSMIKPSEPALRRLTSASSESNRLPPNRCAMACAAYKARGDGLLAFISAGLSQRFGQRLARVYSKRQQYPPGFGRAMQCRAQLGQELASPQLAATPDRIHRRRRVGLKHRRPGYSRANRCSPHLWLNRQPQHVIGAGSHRIVGSGIRIRREDQDRQRSKTRLPADQRRGLHRHPPPAGRRWHRTGGGSAAWIVRRGPVHRLKSQFTGAPPTLVA